MKQAKDMDANERRPPAHCQHAAEPPRRVDSRELFDVAREIEIDHNGQVYRLRRTSTGKLILTK